MSVEHVDVLIVGAGLAGIGAACQLSTRLPDKTYAILEGRDATGGTWDLFRYPGVRSDSDMFTLGYAFKPWTGAKAIADGESILAYLRDTARSYGVNEHIRLRHKAVRASWSSDTARWTVEAHRGDTGETVELTCSFLFCCTGYYRYDEGYTPTFAGIERYAGQVVHPQRWPDDLDYAGKRVTVIGSGATAVTLVPAMAKTAAHVTMVQRSPTYMAALPSRDGIADALRRWLPAGAAYAAVRWKNVVFGSIFYQLCRRRPAMIKALLRRGLVRQLPEGYDIDTDFTPRYNPWDQRMCLVPDGDFFRAMRRGAVSVVTDQIETFTERGIRLASGTEIESDIVVTATGLNLLAAGGMSLEVDGVEVSLPDTVAYKGMMLSGVPNLALALGYTNASWTLRAGLVSGYVCRLLSHMDRHGYAFCTPLAPAGTELAPLLNLTSGYIQRSAAMLPKQATRAPWKQYQNYPRELVLLRHRSVEDEGIRFSRASAPVGSTV
jgi:cation diffusion facilitator CzcD-associated flavoprotein CzcO